MLKIITKRLEGILPTSNAFKVRRLLPAGSWISYNAGSDWKEIYYNGNCLVYFEREPLNGDTIVDKMKNRVIYHEPPSKWNCKFKISSNNEDITTKMLESIKSKLSFN